MVIAVFVNFQNIAQYFSISLLQYLFYFLTYIS